MKLNGCSECTSIAAMLTIALFTILLMSDETLAFTPSSHYHHHPTTKVNVWGKASSTSSTTIRRMAVDETDFEGVDLVRLLGLRRVKKMIRRQRSEANNDARGGSSAVKTSSPPPPKATPSKEKKQPLKLIIAGAPASGKGTQCEIIKEQFGVVHLSTGDMLRAAVTAQTDVGKTAKEYMDSGKLVPDDVIIGVVKDRLCESDCTEKGWLLDGFPRTPAQATALSSAGITADCFLFLNVPDDILVERVVGRRTDPQTGKIYHMTFSPPTDEEVLGRLEQRSDDTEEKVKVRLEQFHANVDAVKGSYSDIAVEIDGTAKPDDVATAIQAGITARLGI